MREKVLGDERAGSVVVYAVWVRVLAGDDREAAVRARVLFDDDRVAHGWDGERAAGRWFHDHVVAGIEGFRARPVFAGGIAWDSYFLFDSEARWTDDGLARPVARGAPVVRDPDPLLGALGLTARDD